MKDPDQVRANLQISIKNGVAPNPVLSFEEACLPRYLVESLKDFDKPTPI